MIEYKTKDSGYIPYPLRYKEQKQENGKLLLATVVFCSGYLKGTWLNGEAFSEIRFIDRFIVSNMKIKFQSVWNDMAESLR